MSVIDALVDRKDVIVYDAESHACIIDGLRMHMGKRFVYPHNDIENLQRQLQRAEKLTKETGGGILVITEGVFGMSGNMGNLKDIVALKDKFNFTSVMRVPKITKICVNKGVGDAVADKKLVDHGVDELSLITGQKAVPTIAKKSVSNFKLRGISHC